MSLYDVSLPEELRDQIDARCRLAGRRPEEFVRHALRYFLREVPAQLFRLSFPGEGLIDPTALKCKRREMMDDPEFIALPETYKPELIAIVELIARLAAEPVLAPALREAVRTHAGKAGYSRAALNHKLSCYKKAGWRGLVDHRKARNFGKDETTLRRVYARSRAFVDYCDREWPYVPESRLGKLVTARLAEGNEIPGINRKSKSISGRSVARYFHDVRMGPDGKGLRFNLPLKRPREPKTDTFIRPGAEWPDHKPKENPPGRADVGKLNEGRRKAS